MPPSQTAMLLFCVLTLAATIRAQKPLLPGSCTFESDTCGYTSDADFRRWTLNNDGHFVTVDTASANLGGDGMSPDNTHWRGNRGILLSPALDQGEWSCMRLVYQITMSGSLQVLQRTEGKSFDQPLWSSQTPSESWVITSLDLHNSTELSRIIIEGRPGESTESSVAIFEIHISPGFCLECDFEEPHLCGYSNQWNSNVNWYVGGGMAQAPRTLPNDHTFKNISGHYMYVDSIYAKTFKEVAKLVSPMTTVPLSGCLTFQYQRNEERGNLFSIFTRDQAGQFEDLWRVDLESHNDWTATPGEWLTAQVELRAPYPLQVVFEVAFNSPRGGQVAVDDISFSPVFCSADAEPTFDPSIANCDFEVDLCSYTQDYLTGSPWRRVSVKPNIFRNGDHTTGAGSFLLSHSSLGLRSGYMSRLSGPTLPASMKYCLRFFFQVRGFTQMEQALTVYLQQQMGTQEKLWTQAVRSRAIWIGADVTFQTSQPVKVVFVSTCRSLWDCGSVALDDITVSFGDCELTGASGSLLFIPGHCDFEKSLCSYTQDKQDDTGDWVWRRGPTPTSYTGPSGDHTTGLGYYMYIEASLMLPGQNAQLLSGPLRGSRGPRCLHFYYHMYGSGTGQLTVSLDKDGGKVLLWQQHGEKSIAWLRASVEYQCDRQHQIVFQAIRGSSVRSDIAIDDIMFTSGPCPELEVGAGKANRVSNEIE